jgi:hypothetical protein
MRRAREDAVLMEKSHLLRGTPRYPADVRRRTFAARGLLNGVRAVGDDDATAAKGLSQHWLAIADLLPLLAVLPCAVMMLHCMQGMKRGPQTDTAQALLQNEAPSLPTSEAKATDPVKWAG